MINYYFRDRIDAGNCEAFQSIVEDYPSIHFFQPSPDKAPWHVQAFLADGEIELNFWPHKIKGQRRPMASVEGEGKIRAMIGAAMADAMSDAEGEFDVLED